MTCGGLSRLLKARHCKAGGASPNRDLLKTPSFEEVVQLLLEELDIRSLAEWLPSGHMAARHFPIDSQLQQRTETRPSEQPGNWPPFLGREVPHSGTKIKRGRVSPRCVRYGKQRSVRLEKEAVRRIS
uniref:RxLR effector candidate protein n=1 Tax=Hyaloperonospora arabidopsidis (strain Emoy2) TaxID=559515 RepID=M4B1F0_HYAAE